MKTIASLLATMFLFAFVASAQDKNPRSSNNDRRPGPAEIRERIDDAAGEALDELFATDPKAKELFDKSVGYAVFNSVKVAFFLSGGGGEGVAVAKETGHRTYMNMGKLGIGLGLGGQNYRIVFLFEDEDTFRNFVNSGWQAGADASAAGGVKGVNAAATFHKGMAIYQITKAGVMLHADISGTKVWKSRKLNEQPKE